MRLYHRYYAVQYAVQWALNRNPDFRDYSGQGNGGDCTNFVSQALLAGGWHFAPGHPYDPITWFNAIVPSRSWSAAENFRLFIKATSRAKRCELKDLVLGDLVFINRNKEDSRAGHLMMVTGLEPGAVNKPMTAATVYLSYHTRDTKNKSLKLIMLKYDEELFEYWKVADIIPDNPPLHLGMGFYRMPM